MRLAGKVAIITGAASGIGRATAVRFAQEGARVVVADINTAGGQETVKLVKSQGGEAAFVATDVGWQADLEQMIAFAVNTFGGLDILHNNALWTDAKPLLETTLDNWQRTLDVTLRPVFLASQLVVSHLRARGGGVILNTASVQSIIGARNYIAYQAAKGGVLSLTRALALELAPQIRVIAILPGAIDTPTVSQDDKSAIGNLIALTPMGRLGKPEEIANLAAFLASDEAAFITGTGIVIDGGFTTQ